MRLVTHISKQSLFTIGLTLVSPVLIMLLIGFFARPKPPAPVATNIMNPQSAQDWMERCEAIFMNENGEALKILGKERGCVAKTLLGQSFPINQLTLTQQLRKFET